ncbi:MobQ family relaxase [Bengtsoniella intestinalis]|uniref:MobQ family relaxase n=1 Tax=Bengtsoniella intestinalis TaxID=3073143 RepID=UPI00391F4D65
MALFHFSVSQIKRSAGQSVIAAAAYRAGESLFSERYGETNDFTKKGGVVTSEILLPTHAPTEYSDRQTLWNAVESAERGKAAQLAYSFDIALQNELSMEENIALTRQFLQEHFVSRGMIADYAIHQPDRERGGNPNPHFHVLCPIRPLDEQGKWTAKQRRVYRTDSEGNRLRDEKGIALFDAVATTDWGKPETLEFWRSKWAETVNEALSRRGAIERVDNRSYQRQGIDQIPTIHEGVAVREMEAKGTPTGKGNRNRWITATNASIRDLKGKITALLTWLKEVRETPQPPTSPSLIELLQSYYNQRNRTAWSGKAKLGNLKDFSKAINYLTEQRLHTLADLEGKVTSISDRVDTLKGAMDSKGKRVKELDELLRYAEMYGKTLPVFEEMSHIKFKGRQETFKTSHESELRQYYMAKRKLTPYFTETGKLPLKLWRNEQDQLRQEQAQDYEAYKPLREELTQLLKVRHCTEIAQRDQPHTEPQSRDQHDR